MSGTVSYTDNLIPGMENGMTQASQTSVQTRSLDGVDPDTDNALRQGDDNTREHIDRTGKNAKTGKEAVEALSAKDRESGGKFSELDPIQDKIKNALGGFASAMPQTQMPPMPQMPQIPLDQIPGMTQDQFGGAGNKEQLINALLGAVTGPDGSKMFNGVKVGDAPGQIAVGEGKDGDVQSLANQLVGANIPYAWGGGGLDGPSQGTTGNAVADRMGDYNKVGFDCSGLSRYMTYQTYGVEIPRTSEQQYASGMPVSASEARPGDLFFPSSAGRPPGHVQVYVGNNEVVEAPSSGQTVKFSGLQNGEFRRFVS